jgi:hypothetical protein
MCPWSIITYPSPPQPRASQTRKPGFFEFTLEIACENTFWYSREHCLFRHQPSTIVLGYTTQFTLATLHFLDGPGDQFSASREARVCDASILARLSAGSGARFTRLAG